MIKKVSEYAVKFFKPLFLASFLLVVALAVNILFDSCLQIHDYDDDDYTPANPYGSLAVTTGNSSNRALCVSDITAADVTVSGTGFSPISQKNVLISGGVSSSAVKIEKIPVGNNRVVSGEAKTNIGNILSKMAGVKMTSVTNITSGDNSVSVNWENSRLGNVFESLLALGYDVSALDTLAIKNILPDTHASLIDSSKLAADIKNSGGNLSGLNPENYRLSPGSLSFTSDDALSLVFQICDPVSEKLTSVVPGSNTIQNIAPGTWKVFGIVNGKSVIYNSSVKIESGKNQDLGKISFKAPKPRLENADGSQISEFINSETTVYLKARNFDGEEEISGVSIYYTLDGSQPSSSSTKYSGGIRVNAGTKLKAIAVVSGLFDSDVASWDFSKPTLGYTHPANGDFSAVDLNGQAEGFGWASGNWPLGANVSGGETTFALYSANAEKILLEIYAVPYGEDALYDYWMEKDGNDVWRAKLSGNLSGAVYAFRVWGTNWKYDSAWSRGGSSAGFEADYDSFGNRFNPNKVVYDPYAKELTHDVSNAEAIAAYKTKNAGYALSKPEYAILSSGQPVKTSTKWREYDSGTISPKGYVVSDSTGFGSKPKIAASEARIYEAHVRGITQHDSSSSLSSILNGIEGFEAVQNVPAQYRGTYKGASYMAPYLKALGINTIELLPVHETDNDANPNDGPGGNYWGYMTFGYFAPDRRYSFDKSAGGPTKEFKEMVEAFHNEGIEVYLDVVYNHSGEGGTWNGSKTRWNSSANQYEPNPDYDEGKQCTVVSMRGIDNQTYYSLCTDKKWSYWETTGCGNNLQCDNPVVRQLIIDSLSYWISEMGVDGFRFDLAPVLGREGTGSWNFSSSAATLTKIASLGSANDVEMIAEAWDCQWPGGYKIGKFPSGWGDWNGVYRDVVRKYVGGAGTTETKSDYGNVLYNLNIGNALYGSSDIFGSYRPSVNMIVAHDGFTLADLSSYSGKGNAMNGNAWPFGPSDGGNGDTNYIVDDTPSGHRQINRNYIALQMVTRGIPMIVWGDEFSRTQNGNNNPYNIDSVATWNNYNMINTKSPQGISTGGSGTYNDKFGTFGNTKLRNGNFIFMKRMLEMHSDPAFTQPTYTTPSYIWNSGKDENDFSFGYKISGSKVTDGHDFFFFSNMTGGEVKVTVPAPENGCHWVRICDTGSWAEKYENSWDVNDTEADGYYSISTEKDYGVGAHTVVIFEQIKDGGEGPVVPTCAIPSIIGESQFESSTTVTITCGTAGSTIYYTLDGSSPSTLSTEYTGSFILTESATVKAVAVAQGYKNSLVAQKKFKKESFVISDKSGVMLQGFTWESASRTVTAKQGKWYKIMSAQADVINDTFKYLWCPPPTMSASMGPEGYMPTQLNVLDSFYGTGSELSSLLSKFTKTMPIADIVINHRCGTTNWGDFSNPDFGVVKGSNYQAICSDDEGFSAAGSDMYNNSVRGNADTGGKYGDARDIDHTNPIVQAQIVKWMNEKLKSVGFKGWRYDFVKGYDGYYVGKYDAETDAQFSVGELWEDFNPSNPNGLGDTIKNWVARTETGGYRSRAFDFALKGVMNTVFGNKGSGIANSNYGFLENAASLMISQPADSVTFVDNHDTGSTQGHWYLDPDDVGTAYAFILTHPGIPCVAWQHYFNDSESGGYNDSQYIGGKTVPGTGVTYRKHIDKLIEIRKKAGIEYDSPRTTLAANNSVYAAKIEGANANLVVVIGSGSYTPSGDYGRIYKGTNFVIWQEGAEDVYGGGGESLTLSVTVPSWVWSDGAAVFAWVWGDSATGEWITVTGSGTTAVITVPSGTKGFNMARCVRGTTAPDWSAKGNSAGRIYNKSEDVVVPSDYYGTNWVEYNP